MRWYLSRLFEQLKKEVVVDVDEEKDVSDEELLNVFRYADESDRVMKAKEIGDEVGLSKKQVSNRLEELEGERVHKKDVSPTHVWWLDDDEPQSPVRTGANTEIWLSFVMRDAGRAIIYLGAAACGFTVLLLMMYLAVGFFPSLSALLTQDTAAEFAFHATLGGVFYLVLGGFGYLGSKLILRQNKVSTE